MKTPREFAYQVTAVTLLSVAAGLLLLAGLTVKGIVLVIAAMPLVIVGIMFGAEYRKLRRAREGGASTAELRRPQPSGVDTVGAQTHGAAGGGFFGGV
ncbi:hypothetical protein [Homoserinimonas hongtaonis]|uniref:Uncharacterized protein n=1 Tax=Homoserinimonas hongtaonis TaxID=2079791 RepID=A0A2U1SXT3_9MICO|nr:hypothetical protein [Salinibacterium hongtaonis]PWB96440.1 hypothetical protein DF220_00210 [Salinibacterium hongtaonis]